MNLSTAAKLFDSLKVYFFDLREKYSDYESRAKNKMPNCEFEYLAKRDRTRSIRLTRNDGPEKETKFSGNDKFKVEAFLPALDSLITEISKRGEAYGNIGENFHFLSNLMDIEFNELSDKCKNLVNTYKNDLDYDDILNECIHFKNFLNSEENSFELPALYETIVSGGLKSIFPNIEIALRIFLCMMITNCTGERSFSKLKLIKKSITQHYGTTTLELAMSDVH
nr:uncharacterized protein LOC122272707 [Parasteatoda tepidariorum]